MNMTEFIDSVRAGAIQIIIGTRLPDGTFISGPADPATLTSDQLEAEAWKYVDESVREHKGPGPHESGSPQSVHGVKGGEKKFQQIKKKKGLAAARAAFGKQSVKVGTKFGVPLNPDGTITLYHGTTKTAAKSIAKEGGLRGREDGVFLTTSRSHVGYGDTVIAVKVNPALLELDDEFPDGRKDFRIPAKPNELVKVSVVSEPKPKSNAARIERALRSYNPATKEKQSASDKLESELAKSLGLKRTGDNNPMDVESADGSVGVEVKMMHDAKEHKVHMRPDSRKRKEAWVKAKRGRRAYTVILDNRDKFEGGKHKAKYSGHKIYWREGVGAFRLQHMNKAASVADLKRSLGL